MPENRFLAHIIPPLVRPNIWSLRRYPFYFLHGPILGDNDWQSGLNKLLAASSPCVIANLAAYHIGHAAFGQCLDGPSDFTSQLAWERHYMLRAAEDAPRGALVFWLPRASVADLMRDGNHYALHTLGEWRGHLVRDSSLRVVVGVQDGFPSSDMIRESFRLALGDSFPVYHTLDDVVRAAIHMASSQERENYASARC